VPEAEDQRLINDVIFDELCLGVFKEESRSAYAAIIGKLRDKGCDAVALVCTEIPLLVTPGVSPLPTLDSTRLLAKAAVEVAIGDHPMPEWRGGPLA
jgi:aspartate racemase